MSAGRRRVSQKILAVSALGVLVNLPLAGIAGQHQASSSFVDPLTQISGSSPFAECTADDPPSQNGTVFLHSEVEPWVAVNPTDPFHIVAYWQQDRWSNGGARGNAAGVSFDGGITWEMVPVPGLSRCTGGLWLRATDPWLSFGPGGELYQIALSLSPGNNVVASKSLDGGLTWSEPVRLSQTFLPFFDDKESITADPYEPGVAYASWTRFQFVRGRGPAMFTRTTDGGVSWEPPRVIHDPGPRAQTIGTQIVVLPDGTVLDFFTEIFGRPFVPTWVAFKSSPDKGRTWQPPVGAWKALRIYPRSAVTPDEGVDIRDGDILFDVAVDPRNGNLYAVWQEDSLTSFQYAQVAFSMSRNGGLTWTDPFLVNRTPQEIEPLNRQAFLPSVHVSANGMVAVTYYDFRFNDPEPGAMTDYWLTWCHPGAADCSKAGRWREELRLTDESFDYLLAPIAGGLFVGDYVGLAAAGDDFVVVFTMPHDTDPSSAFARRVVIPPVIEPEATGFWSHQVTANLTERGRAHETEQDLFAYLNDIRFLYDVFDGVGGLEGMNAVLRPETPAGMRERAEQNLMALLLNLTSGRLSPHAEVTASETVVEAIDTIIGVVEDPAAERETLEAAKDLAERINSGRLPID
jgi:hypothetical protein